MGPSCQACKQLHLHVCPVEWLNTNVLFSDGRAVTSEAQLWAVPDTIVARTPNVKSSENIRVPSALIAGRLPDCNIGKTCNQDDDCPEWNCVQCVGADSPGPCMNGACPPVSPDGGCHGQL
jgi:hypothetical protein